MTKTILILVILTLLGAFFRIYQLDKNPPSLNVDEVANGYDAYSILKTGKDQYGNFLPLSFKSLGDYKPPVYIYLTVPFVYFLGLTEFAVRLPSALIGTITIALTYIFIKKITNNSLIGLVGATIITFSPWHIYESRFALETGLSMLLTLLGCWSVMVAVDNKKLIYFILAPVSLGLAMYTYQTERLFVPIFIISGLFLYRKYLWSFRKKLLISGTIFGLICLPFIIQVLFGAASTRAQMVLINREVNFIRYILIPPLPTFNFISYFQIFDNQILLLFLFWIHRYINYLNPVFLFVNGLDMTLPNTFSSGILYLFEAISVPIGILSFVFNRNKYQGLLFSWLLLGLIPASVTLGDTSARRVMVDLPIFTIFSSIGLVAVGSFILRQKPIYKYGLTLIGTGVISLNILHVFLIYSFVFPKERGEGFMEGTKSAITYVLKHQQEYKEVVFDPLRGTDGPYLRNVPHLYYLFYSRMDPQTYQNTQKIMQGDYSHFNHFTVRPIDWRSDRSNKGILYIGSHWSLPDKDLQGAQVLKTIYMSNGQEAYRIVTVK